MKAKVELLGYISRGILIPFLVYAATSKFAAWELYKRHLFYQPFSTWILTILLYLIPLIELGNAILLTFEKTAKKGLLLSILISSMFTLYTIVVLLNIYSKTPCPCGGIIEELTWPQHLLLTLTLLVVSLVGYYYTQSTKRNSNHTNPPQLA